LHTVNNHFVPAGLFEADSIFKFPNFQIIKNNKHFIRL